MKAEELRIGNWVGNIGDPNEYRIAAQNILVEAKANKQGYTRYRPIPLTEEWLLKFGFANSTIENDKWSFSVFYYDCWRLVYKEKKGYGSSDAYLEGFFFIHELQNIYHALTGEELKTK